MHKHLLIFICLFTMFACKSKVAVTADAEATPEVQTPVTVTTVSSQSMAEYVELSAISTYMQSSFIKSTAVGYIQKSNLKPGRFQAAWLP